MYSQVQDIFVQLVLKGKYIQLSANVLWLKFNLNLPSS